MEGRPRLKRGRGEGKGKGGEGREEGDVGGPRDILSRGPQFLVTPLFSSYQC